VPAKLETRASKSKEWEEIVGAYFQEQAQEVADNASTYLMPLYQRTLKFWNQSGTNKFPIPSISIEVKVKRLRRSIKILISIRIFSKLWGWLDQGTPDIIQPKTSPPIRERRALRTTPDDLDVTPFPGFTGRTFVIHAGRRRRGIPARNWNRTIARLYKQAAQVKPDTFHNFEVIKLIVNGKVES